MKVQLTKSVRFGPVNLQVGDVVDLPDEQAQRLLVSKRAVKPGEVVVETAAVEPQHKAVRKTGRPKKA